MRMRNYLKKRQVHIDFKTIIEKMRVASVLCGLATKRNFILASLLGLGVFLAAGAGVLRCFSDVALSEEGGIQLSSAPIAATSAKKGVISIPAGTVKANPFMPYRDLGETSVQALADVPAYNLVEPPEEINESSDAARVMDTIVSGILYDKYSPSAIINIEGNDYLVKKGDIVNNYKVVNIVKDSVTVKLGANTYKAGIGEILTEGSLNYNEVPNLSNKFGGEK